MAAPDDHDLPTQTVSLLLLGDESVGKSTFLSRLSQIRGENGLGQAAGSLPQLLRDSDQPFVLEMRSRRSIFRLEFYDTASPEHWRCLRPDLVLVCYDIGHRPSLASLPSVWIKEIRTVFPQSDELPILVLGLKRDLRREDTQSIHAQEAYAIAQQIRADMYLECSALTGTLMVEVLDDICRRAVRTASKGNGQSDGSCLVM